MPTSVLTGESDRADAFIRLISEYLYRSRKIWADDAYDEDSDDANAS